MGPKNKLVSPFTFVSQLPFFHHRFKLWIACNFCNLFIREIIHISTNVLYILWASFQLLPEIGCTFPWGSTMIHASKLQRLKSQHVYFPVWFLLQITSSCPWHSVLWRVTTSSSKYKYNSLNCWLFTRRSCSEVNSVPWQQDIHMQSVRQDLVLDRRQRPFGFVIQMAGPCPEPPD